ncbi:MATE family efflux transporter [Maribacter luteus]|uniref:MATE family efflux transporter n=1 Tax=Maribacter luteus TaxID=2594478 RepID=UPI0024902878|nr:MATE family efflux transporter [Maribacter luteus]
MQHAKRVAKNTGILYVQMAITVVMSLYTTRLVLAALGAEDFGVFNVVGGAIAMLTFLNAAMASASQRFMSFAQGQGDFDKQKTIFNVSLVLHFFIGIALVALLEVVGLYLFEDVLKIAADRMDVAKLIYQFLIVSTFFTIVSVPFDAVINAHENMLLVAIVRIIEVVLKLAIALYLTKATGDKLYLYGFLMASLTIVLMLFKQLYCHRAYGEVRINIKKYFSKPIFKEMSSFAGWSLLGSAASMLTMQGMTILINSFFGVIVNAAQGIALQITGQLMAFSNTMLKALNPVIVKSEGESNRDKMLKASISGNKLSFFLLAFFAIPVIIEMPFILKLWLKNVPEYTVVFCRLNLFRSTLTQLTVTFPTAIGATGNIKKSQQVESIIWILLLPVSYVMFSLGAAPEVIYVNLIGMVIGLSASRIYFTCRICGMSFKNYLSEVISKCFSVSFITAALAFIPVLLMQESFTRFALVLLISIFFFIVLFLVIGLDKAEKKLVLALGQNIANKIK